MSKELNQKKGKKRGVVMSEETKAKISQKAKGRKLSEETKAKIINTRIKNGNVLREDRHPFWKGGKPWERFKDPAYIQWRNQVLKRDGYICQDCGKHCKKNERGLAAHHIKSYKDYPELRLDVDNGVTLCKKCHMARHGKNIKEEKILCACGCGTLIDAFDKYHKRPRQYVNGHYRTGKTNYTQEVIFCACGCGETKNRFDKNARENLYKRGHRNRGRVVPESTKQLLRSQRLGKKLSPEHRARVKEGLVKSLKKIGRPPVTEWTNSYLTEQEFIELYSVTKTSDMAKICHVTRGTINRWAHNLGINKGKQ